MTTYNLSAFAGAGAQFFDDDGVPLVGGKLYSYESGTTTLLTTYTTSTGTVANTNPIILNAAGRTPNEIWLATGVLYKFILTTSTDVLIGTYDGVPSINDPLGINSQLGSIVGTNTITATSTPTLTSYASGTIYSFIAANTNTGAVTLSIDGLAAKSVTKNGSVALTAGDIQAGKMMLVEYDNTAFQLINNIVYGGSITNGNIVSLTAPISAANGGTGVASPTANSVLLANGAAAFQTVAPGSAGNVLVSDGTTWTAQSYGAPIVGAFSGLKVSTTSTTAIAVTANYVVLGATSGSYTSPSVSVSISTAASGVNGLDTGTIANGTWYSVWVIYNGTTVSGLLSLSATTPTLPTGYTYKARVGWVRYGTGALLSSIQYGRRAQYVATSSGLQAMSSGAASLWTGIAVAAYIPSTASVLHFTASMQTVTGTIAVSANSSPSSAISGGAVEFSTNGAYVSYANMAGSLVLESANIYWYSVGASNALYVQGWEDNL